MQKLKLYLDTSVISFVYADDAPEKQAITKEFFEQHLGVYDVYISSVVLAEIENTSNAALKNKLKDVVKNYALNVLQIALSEQPAVFSLAELYAREKIIPRRKFEDAVHVAICTYYGFDVLLSWNFRHLANISKQIQVNAINQKQGYLKPLHLINPMEVINEKD